MGTLRSEISEDLADLIEGDFGVPVELVDPDGNVIKSPVWSSEAVLFGQVLYDRVLMDPQTGAAVLSTRVTVTLRRASLPRIPSARERWVVRVPSGPEETEISVSYLLSQARKGGKSGGYIVLELTLIKDQL